MHIKQAFSDLDLVRCFPIMVQLRPHLTESEFTQRVLHQHKAGYSLVYLEENGTIKAVAGFRIWEKLSDGRQLYVDDLITNASERSSGYGSALLDWLVEYAKSQACSSVQLDSNELPEANPAANKKIETRLTDQNGVTFTARINAKSWRKAEADATTFSDWGGAVSGKLGQATNNGFEVVDTGIKVFEKKAKEPKPESTTVGTDATPIV